MAGLIRLERLVGLGGLQDWNDFCVLGSHFGTFWMDLGTLTNKFGTVLVLKGCKGTQDGILESNE